MEQLDGTVAIVTGAASGIGLAITEALVLEGCRVAMCDIDDASLNAHAIRLGDGGADVLALVVDVSDPDAVDEAGLAAVERFGKLNIAVNNAGIVNGGKAWELSLDDWHRVLNINLWGVIHGVRSFVPHILASGEEGHVVNTASMAAVRPVPGIAPYTVAKHGVLGLSDVLRADLAAVDAPVGVSVLMPGKIQTGMNPIGTVSAATVAANALDAIRRNRPYVFTDDHSTGAVERRLQAILAARGDVV
jgi:NAD(P)-dependent dehydrogenase (short-subunit alcohol dehydrogenase family)